MASWDPWDKMGNRLSGASKYQAWSQREQLFLVCRWTGLDSSPNFYVKIHGKKWHAGSSWENAGWAWVMSLSSFSVSTTCRGVCLQVLEITLNIWYPKPSFLIHMPLLCALGSVELSKLMAGGRRQSTQRGSLNYANITWKALAHSETMSIKNFLPLMKSLKFLFQNSLGIGVFRCPIVENFRNKWNLLLRATNAFLSMKIAMHFPVANIYEHLGQEEILFPAWFWSFREVAY